MSSNTGWLSSTDAGTPGNNPSTNNKSGFSALPGGYRNLNGSFSNIGHDGYWWSSTESYTSDVIYRGLGSNYDSLDGNYGGKVSGFSVRCLRD
jgi:uncharacterized protein (TIGR02145 family)